MAGRRSKEPNLALAGGRVAWLRLQIKPYMTQDQLAEELGYGHQSGVGNLEQRDTIPPKVAIKIANYFRKRLSLPITTEWLHNGGPVPTNETFIAPVKASPSTAWNILEPLILPLSADARESVVVLLRAWVLDPKGKRGNLQSINALLAVPAENERVEEAYDADHPKERSRSSQPPDKRTSSGQDQPRRKIVAKGDGASND